MGLSLTDIENALETGLEFVQKAAPLAAIGGPQAGAIGELIAKVAGTADSVIQGVAADATIIAGGDLTKIRSLQQQLHAENAKLAGQVDES